MIRGPLELALDAGVYGEALVMYTFGYRDMMDDILYANSIRCNLRLLTLDKELRDFVSRNGLWDTLLLPDKLAGGSDRERVAPARDSFKKF